MHPQPHPHPDRLQPDRHAQAEQGTAGSDDRDRQLLADTARRHIGGLDVRAVNCLSAAADELTDPLRPPALVELADDETADAAAVAAAVRARLLDPTRPGTVGQVMARGWAARELTDALQLLAASPGTAAGGQA